MEFPQPNLANVMPFPNTNQPMQNGLNDESSHLPRAAAYPPFGAVPSNQYSTSVHHVAAGMQKMNIDQDAYGSHPFPAYPTQKDVTGPPPPASLPTPMGAPPQIYGGAPPLAPLHQAAYQSSLQHDGIGQSAMDGYRSASPMVTGQPPMPDSGPAMFSSGRPPHSFAQDNATPATSMPAFSSPSLPPAWAQSEPVNVPSMNAPSAHPPPLTVNAQPPMNPLASVPRMTAPTMSHPSGMTSSMGPPPFSQPSSYPPPMSGPGTVKQAGFPPPMQPYPQGAVPPTMGPPGQPAGGPGAAYPPGFPSGPAATPLDGMGGGAGAVQKRLDPHMMPSLIQVVEDDRKARSGLFQTGIDHAEQPPLVTTDFFSEDQGNCNPKFIRATVYSVPISNDFVKQTAIPVGLCMVPLANLSGEEAPVPIVDCGDTGPVRCNRCKAYMCSFMMFFDGGRRFRCPFCSVSTSVPEHYFAHLDHTGRRIDANERPELYLGSYEFAVTKEYCKDGVWPQPPVFMFMVDVSYNAIRSGLLRTFCDNIKALLHNLPQDQGKESLMEVAFVTYDNSVHFYDLKTGNGLPKMLVVSDVQEVFVPTGKNLFVRPSEAGAVIDRLLEKIWTIFGENKATDVVLGPVLQAGVETLKAYGRPGKLFIFHSSLPVFEAPGKLKSRDDRKLLGTDKEKTILLPQGDFYTKLAEDCVSVGCCVDVFLFPNSHVDVATIGSVCSLTGGQVYKYPFFEAETDAERFFADLKHDIERPIVFDAICRLRTSQGLRPTDFFGNFYMSNTTDVELAALDADKCIVAEIKHDDKLEQGNAYFQLALLFTSVAGQRRLRVHNLALATAPDFPSLYRSADLFAMLNLLCKQVHRQMLHKNPKDVKEGVVNKTAQSLATYRQKCSPSSSLGQLVLPEAMKLLPLFVNCIFKNDSFVGGSELTVDDRAWLMHIVPSMSIDETIGYFYPTVIPVISLDSAQEMPTTIRCLYENMASDQAYLLDNNVLLFLWVGTNAPAQWIQDVFGVNTFAQINADKHVLPEKDNPTSRTLRCLIEEIQAPRQRKMKLFIVKQQDRMEPWFKKFLVEDRTDSHPSYVEFLCLIHKEIRSLLA